MRCKLLKMSIDGYKNIVNTFVDLHDMTVIVGPNNSGKSNFLEIFGLLDTLFFGSDENRESLFEDGIAPGRASIACHLPTCMYRPISISLESLIENFLDDKTYVVQYDMKIRCQDIYMKNKEMDIETGFLSEELRIKEKNKTGPFKILIKRGESSFDIRKPDGKNYTNKINMKISALSAINVIYPDFEKIDKDIRQAFYSIVKTTSTSVFFVSSDSIRKNIGSGSKGNIWSQYKVNSFDILNEIYLLSKNENKFKEFENALCNILDLDSIVFHTFDIPNTIKNEGKSSEEKNHYLGLRLPGQGLASIREFSDGTLVVIAILLCVLSEERKDTLLCIEEPENCLHPRALKTLINYLRQVSEQTQIIFTTHSQAILNMVPAEDIICAESRGGEGTSFKGIDNIDELMKRLRSSNFDLGSLLETDFKFEEGEAF